MQLYQLVLYHIQVIPIAMPQAIELRVLYIHIIILYIYIYIQHIYV